MKAMTMSAVAFAAVAYAACGATVERVIVRQQWPWSTDVKVEYRLSGVTEPTDLVVEALNGSEPIESSALHSAIEGKTFGITTDGDGSFTIDPIKAFGKTSNALANFRVRLTPRASAANIGEVLYKVYDLKSGTCEEVTRAMLLNGEKGAVSTDYSALGQAFGAAADEFSTPLEDVLVWTAVTNDVKYKTTHLVMRKIPAKGKSYTMGANAAQSLGKSSDNQKVHTVSFTNDYYMSVFELTEGQFLTLVTNSSYSIKSTMNFTNATDRYMRPYYAKIGNDVAPHISDWPTGGHVLTTEKSVLHILRTRTHDNGFDMPTEAVWEYACRAGSTNDLYIGQNYSSQRLSMLARWKSNKGNDSNYNSTSAEGGTAIVGSYAPNAWGLYDMYGNLIEYCLDRYIGDLSAYSGDDPWGPTSSEATKTYYYRVWRGGEYSLDQNYGPYSSYRTFGDVSNNRKGGVRLCLTVY